MKRRIISTGKDEQHNEESKHVTDYEGGASPDFSTVLSACLDEVFAIFDHQAFAKSLLPVNATINIEQTGRRIHEVKNNADALAAEPAKKVTLANLLPSISRQAHLVIAGNEYLNVCRSHQK